MTLYKMEKTDEDSTLIKIETTDKLLFNRLELAIDYVFKEFEERKK